MAVREAPRGELRDSGRLQRALEEEGFRRAVLEFLVRQQALSEALRSRMLGWRYSGFSAHNQVRLGEEDAEGRKKAKLPGDAGRPMAGAVSRAASAARPGSLRAPGALAARGDGALATAAARGLACEREPCPHLPPRSRHRLKPPRSKGAPSPARASMRSTGAGFSIT